MKNHLGAFALSWPLVLAGAGSALAAGGAAAPEAAASSAAAATCSEATLHGTYLFAYDGLTLGGKDRGPFATAGLDVYDGKGHVSSVFTVSTNGQISRFSRVTGTYTVKSDCTGTARYSDGTRYDQFVAPDGSQFVFIQTNRGTVAASFESKATASRVGD